MTDAYLHAALRDHIEHNTQDGPTRTVTSPSGWTVDLPVTPMPPGDRGNARIRFQGALIRGVTYHGQAVLHTYPNLDGQHPNGRLGVLNITAERSLGAGHADGPALHRHLLKELLSTVREAYPNYVPRGEVTP